MYASAVVGLYYNVCDVYSARYCHVPDGTLSSLFIVFKVFVPLLQTFDDLELLLFCVVVVCVFQMRYGGFCMAVFI